jgi:hypothetical protein
MSIVSPLSDGTPLTYEWLNSLANAINKVALENEDDSNVKFVGVGNNGQDVQVILGSVTIESGSKKNTGSKILQNNIKFPVAFDNDDVSVFATITSVGAKQQDNAVPAAVSVGQITFSNFDAVIQLFDGSGKFGKSTLELKYIAVGKKQATA